MTADPMGSGDAPKGEALKDLHDRYPGQDIDLEKQRGIGASGDAPRTASDLLPCPFCGGEAKLFQGGLWWYVDCQSMTCDCKPGTLNPLSEAEAVAQWNRRSVPPSRAPEPEALRREIRAWFTVALLERAHWVALRGPMIVAEDLIFHLENEGVLRGRAATPSEPSDIERYVHHLDTCVMARKIDAANQQLHECICGLDRALAGLRASSPPTSEPSETLELFQMYAEHLHSCAAFDNRRLPCSCGLQAALELLRGASSPAPRCTWCGDPPEMHTPTGCSRPDCNCARWNFAGPSPASPAPADLEEKWEKEIASHVEAAQESDRPRGRTAQKEPT